MRRTGSSNRLKRTWLAAAAVLPGMAATWPALADDPVAVAPEIYKVEFEDADVRVLRVVYRPGDESAMHDHPDSIGVYLSGGRIRITLPDGRVGEPTVPPGSTLRHAAGRHVVQNIGDAPFEMLLIELKRATAAPEPSAAPGS